MRIGKKLLAGSLGFFSILLAGAGVYAAKPGDCPRIREYGPYQNYDVGLVYGGQSELRARQAAELYRDDIRVFVPVSSKGAVEAMLHILEERGGKIAHISGKTHLRRIKMLNETASQEGSRDDGYLPVEDTFGVPFWKFPKPRDSDLAAWWACYRDSRRVGN